MPTIDVVVWFFVLGLVARLAGSPLSVPKALTETLSIYLLLAIGLKGGVEISRQPLAAPRGGRGRVVSPQQAVQSALMKRSTSQRGAVRPSLLQLATA